MLQWTITNMPNLDDYRWVDTSKFNVIEKKEAKIERLDNMLNEWTKLKKHYQDLVDNYTLRAIETSDKIDKIKAELEELEK